MYTCLLHQEVGFCCDVLLPIIFPTLVLVVGTVPAQALMRNYIYNSPIRVWAYAVEADDGDVVQRRGPHEHVSNFAAYFQRAGDDKYDWSSRTRLRKLTNKGLIRRNDTSNCVEGVIGYIINENQIGHRPMCD